MHVRIVLTAVLLCSKFYNDLYFSNEQVATLGGIHFQELNMLEAYFLKQIDFRLCIQEQEYKQYLEGLCHHVQELHRIQKQSE